MWRRGVADEVVDAFLYLSLDELVVFGVVLLGV
jgi:hypothetical protein